MTVKKSLIYLIMCCSCFLIGCGGSSSDQTVSFDTFYITIEDTFRSVPSGMVENKQLLNKVLKSFKRESETGFDTNFIITKSELPPSLDYEQFWTVNTNKLKSYVKGYISNEKRIITIDCKGKELKGIYVSFSVKDSFMQKQDTYYMEQYQFVHDDQGYILSYATDLEKERERLSKKLKTFTCDAPES